MPCKIPTTCPLCDAVLTEEGSVLLRKIPTKLTAKGLLILPENQTGPDEEELECRECGAVLDNHVTTARQPRMTKRKAFSILAEYERCVLGDKEDSPPEVAEAISLLVPIELQHRFLHTRIGCLRQWLKFSPTVPKGNEDLFERLFRHADKYETAQEFVGAIHAGKCFEVGACIKDSGTGMTGFIVREGTVTTKKWPCWVVDSGGGREELMVKDCDSYRDITGCHDTVLVCVWNFANNWKRKGTISCRKH